MKLCPSINAIQIFGDKIVVGKSDIKSDTYDTIVPFACRDIKKIKIPAFIKFIVPFAFDCYIKLTWLEFANNSQLTIIGQESFAVKSFKKIIIPPHVTQIHKNAFYDCELKNIEFAENTEI